MAEGDDRVSVRHRKCCWTLFSGRLIRFILFNVAVSHGSTLVLSTTFGADRVLKAAAEEGSSNGGIVTAWWDGGPRNEMVGYYGLNQRMG